MKKNNKVGQIVFSGHKPPTKAFTCIKLLVPSCVIAGEMIMICRLLNYRAMTIYHQKRTFYMLKE